MNGVDIAATIGYSIYVCAPLIRDELRMRIVLAVSSVVFFVFGLLIPSWPTSVANVIFLALSAFTIRRLIAARRPVTLDDDQRRAREALFPEMSPRDFVLFWALGTHRTSVREQIVTAGTPIERVSLLLEGTIQVELPSGESVQRHAPDLIGDVTFARDVNAGATATVRTVDTALIEWPVDLLADLEETHPALVAPFRGGVSRGLATKLADDATRDD